MKVAWIIGSSTGIGEALAHQLEQEGYNLALSSRNKKALLELQQELKKPDNHLIIPTDVTDIQTLESAKKKIDSHFQLSKTTLEVLLVIHVSGIYNPMLLKKYDHEKSIEMIQTNLIGPFNTFKTIQKEATDPTFPLHIAWVSSVIGYRGLPTSGAYGATKAALINFAETQRLELSRTNTKVQVICPGFVKTSLTDNLKHPKPFMVSPKKAAEFIANGLKKSTFNITFPWQFSIIMKTLRAIPDWLFLKVVNKIF